MRRDVSTGEEPASRRALTGGLPFTTVALSASAVVLIGSAWLGLPGAILSLIAVAAFLALTLYAGDLPSGARAASGAPHRGSQIEQLFMRQAPPRHVTVTSARDGNPFISITTPEGVTAIVGGLCVLLAFLLTGSIDLFIVSIGLLAGAVAWVHALTVRAANPPPPAEPPPGVSTIQRSPDGHHWWDGTRWRPVAEIDEDLPHRVR